MLKWDECAKIEEMLMLRFLWCWNVVKREREEIEMEDGEEDRGFEDGGRLLRKVGDGSEEELLSKNSQSFL